MWKMETQLTALGGYGLVLEDGPERSRSSDEERGMNTHGCTLQEARPTEQQEQLLRLQGRVGGQGTGSWIGSKAPTRAMFE
jgi:hypothetical protein